MSWQERFRNLENRKEEELENKKKERKIREKVEQERRKIVSDLSSRIEPICRGFAQAIGWNIAGGNGSWTIRHPNRGKSDEYSRTFIYVYIDEDGSKNDNGLPCVLVSQNEWLYSYTAVALCKKYEKFLHAVGYPIPEAGQRINFDDNIDKVVKILPQDILDRRGINRDDLPGLPIPVSEFSEDLLAEVLEQFANRTVETTFKSEDFMRSEDTIIKCPVCNNETTIRVQKKGPNVGAKYHVCINHPRCKGKILIE